MKLSEVLKQDIGLEFRPSKFMMKRHFSRFAKTCDLDQDLKFGDIDEDEIYGDIKAIFKFLDTIHYNHLKYYLNQDWEMF